MTLFVPIFKAENCKSPFLRMSDQIWEVNCETISHQSNSHLEFLSLSQHVNSFHIAHKFYRKRSLGAPGFFKGTRRDL